MEIQNPVGAAGGASASGLASAPAILGKEDFLRLLTVQLSHQDPLDPISNEAFVAQLAQFSALEEMQNMNRGLEASHLLETSINNSLAASLIGRDVRATSDAVRLESGAPAEFFVGLESAARVTVRIETESGQAVRALDLGALPAGDNRIVWDGMGDDGGALPAGRYRLRVEAADAAGNPVLADTATTGEVSGLRFFGGRTFLIIDGREVALEDVVEISAGSLNGAL